MLGILKGQEVENVIRQQLIGRLGCYADGRVYVVPVSYAYDGEFIYAFSREGMKVDMMRKNPQVCLQIDNMNNMDNWESVIIWGEFDGTGDPIKMTLNNYLQRFVYDVDFAKPEKRSVNEFIGSGNSLNNLDSVYKDCDFTESHFSGFEKKYEGHDWRTLRLVFKERKGKYFLVGIIHDEWTI